MPAPIIFTWTDDEVMKPLPRFMALAIREFVVGEIYRLVVHEERTTATHNHEFAWLKTAWENLPEAIADQFPSPEHLRKRGLIEAGFYTEEIVDAGSNAAALRVASMVRKRSEFSLVTVRGGYVSIKDAKSQSRRAMDKKEFQASKTALMEVVAAKLGVDPEALSKARAA